MTDEALRIISAKMPDEFVEIVNALLSQGGWRIVQTEMSVCDHHYFAMAIRQSEQPPKESGDE